MQKFEESSYDRSLCPLLRGLYEEKSNSVPEKSLNVVHPPLHESGHYFESLSSRRHQNNVFKCVKLLPRKT